MKYLVDECLGHLIVEKLRKQGHDVEWVRETAKGTPDDTVLDWSVREKRILLTEDFDYGDLIFAQDQPAFGVVILQLSSFPGSWHDVASEMTERLGIFEDRFAGSFTILGRNRIKSRILPAR